MPLAVYGVNWTEYERGWGSRSDGTSFHASEEAARKFIDAYNAKYNNAPVAPDEYSVADEPRIVEVGQALHDYVMAGNDVWLTRLSDGMTWAPKE